MELMSSSAVILALDLITSCSLHLLICICFSSRVWAFCLFCLFACLFSLYFLSLHCLFYFCFSSASGFGIMTSIHGSHTVFCTWSTYSDSKTYVKSGPKCSFISYSSRKASELIPPKILNWKMWTVFFPSFKNLHRSQTFL